MIDNNEEDLLNGLENYLTRSLSFDSMRKILKTMFSYDRIRKITWNLFKLYPEFIEDEKMMVFNRLLKKFIGIFEFIEEDHTIFKNKINYNPYDKKKLSKSLKKWLRWYISLVEVLDTKANFKTIPIYIHIFVYHVPEFISKYNDLRGFTFLQVLQLQFITIYKFYGFTIYKGLKS